MLFLHSLPTGGTRYISVSAKVQGEHSDHHQSSCINEEDNYRHATGGEQHDTGSSAHTQMQTHTHTLTESSAGGKQQDPTLTLTCAMLSKILTTSQPNSIAFVFFSLSSEARVLEKASHPTSIRDADW